MVKTPGGYHIYYRCVEEVPGNLKLARQVGADGRGADLARLVTGDAARLALEERFAGLGITRNLDLRRRA